MKFSLHVWRQASANARGQMTPYSVDGIEPDMSFLEMIDILNEKLIKDRVAAMPEELKSAKGYSSFQDQASRVSATVRDFVDNPQFDRRTRNVDRAHGVAVDGRVGKGRNVFAGDDGLGQHQPRGIVDRDSFGR